MREERVKSSKIENQPTRSKVDYAGYKNINMLFRNMMVYFRRNVEKKLESRLVGGGLE